LLSLVQAATLVGTASATIISSPSRRVSLMSYTPFVGQRLHSQT
jgi:hypothetical protein